MATGEEEGGARFRPRPRRPGGDPSVQRCSRPPPQSQVGDVPCPPRCFPRRRAGPGSRRAGGDRPLVAGRGAAPPAAAPPAASGSRGAAGSCRPGEGRHAGRGPGRGAPRYHSPFPGLGCRCRHSEHGGVGRSVCVRVRATERAPPACRGRTCGAGRGRAQPAALPLPAGARRGPSGGSFGGAGGRRRGRWEKNCHLNSLRGGRAAALQPCLKCRCDPCRSGQSVPFIVS